MNLKGEIIFPLLLLGSITIAIGSEMVSGPLPISMSKTCEASADTVIYPKDNYRNGRKEISPPQP